VGRLEAALRSNDDGSIEVLLANRSGHREPFHVSGVVPEATIELDGNTRYSVNLSLAPESTMVEVRQGGEDGDVLAYRAIER